MNKYAPTRFGTATQIEFKTRKAPKGVDAFWGETFVVPPMLLRTDLQFEVRESTPFAEIALGRVKLPFSLEPGTEPTFAGRSLLYGLDGTFLFSWSVHFLIMSRDDRL